MESHRKEYEVSPGIYLTPSSTAPDPSGDPVPVSPEDYIATLRLQGLLIGPVIDAEQRRLQSLITRLRETNEELASDQDPDMRAVVAENEAVIRKYVRMIELLDAETAPKPGVFV